LSLKIVRLDNHKYLGW